MFGSTIAPRLLLAVPLFFLFAPFASAAKRAITIDDLLAIKGVADPQVSPDGRSVVYVVSSIDRSTEKTNTELHIVAVAGGESRRLTSAPGTNTHPRFSPDGKTIAFVSDRGGSSQIWLLPLDGGEATRLTNLPIDVSGPIWSPQGDRIAFTAEVYPATTPEETAARDKQKTEAKTKSRAFNQLMIRHWNAWDEGKRSHLFVVDVKTGTARDLIPGWTANVPPGPFGGSSDYAFSPDGKELAFTSEPLVDHAWSTNSDIWTIATEEGAAPVNITASNPAADGQPSYSPDGALIAWVSQARAGFEADLWVLRVRHRINGQSADLSSKLDRSIQSYTWGVPIAHDPKDDPRWTILAQLDDQGTEPIVAIDVRTARDGGLEAAPGAPKRVVSGGVNASIQAVPGGEFIVFTRHSSARPAEIHRARIDANQNIPLTRTNEEILSVLDLPAAEHFWFEGAGGANVGGYLLRPPGFDPAKKYPVLFLIHGGPQGAWHDEWHGRWNYAMFLASGYVGVAINPRGSTGYGQAFTDQISRDWTGRVYEDLMKGLDHAIKTYPFLDGEKVAAAGGSYGGFMVNWIAGHTDRFRALISHAGVFDLHSMYFTTEELWFPEWEQGGPPWKSPMIYLEQSPSRFTTAFKTPTLVLHGALDFRVPDVQGIGMFTALQRHGVPSRLVHFPDEGHWIAKPGNRVVWWREVHEWLDKYLGESKPREADK